MADKPVGTPWGKLLLAGSVIAGFVVWGYPELQAFVTEPSVPDQGNRVLVIFSSETADSEFDLTIRSKIVDGSMLIAFSVASADETYQYDDGVRTVEIDVSIAGLPEGASVSCGASSDPLPGQPYETLTSAQRRAVEIDDISSRSSALSFGAGSAGASPEESVDSGVFYAHNVTLVLLETGGRYSQRVTSDDGLVVWSDSCVLSPTAVWRYPTLPSRLRTDRRTLLPPQINWTNGSGDQSSVREAYSRLTVDREPGAVLVESYPPMQVRDVSWYYDQPFYWQGSEGSPDVLGYTDQPVYVFQDRSSEDAIALALVAIGSGLGLIGTLLAYIVSQLLDALRRYFAS